MKSKNIVIYRVYVWWTLRQRVMFAEVWQYQLADKHFAGSTAEFACYLICVKSSRQYHQYMDSKQHALLMRRSSSSFHTVLSWLINICLLETMVESLLYKDEKHSITSSISHSYINIALILQVVSRNNFTSGWSFIVHNAHKMPDKIIQNTQ